MIKVATLLSLLTGIIFQPIVKAENFTYPTTRGAYYLCPNGKGLHYLFWQYRVDPSYEYEIYNDLWDINSLRYPENISRISSIKAELIIGKEAKEYNQEIIDGIKEKMLFGEMNIPTSYKSTKVKPKLWSQEGNLLSNINTWDYKFKNSEGKKLTITRRFGFGRTVTDSRGNTFDTSHETNPIAFMYCTPKSINLRVVEEIKLGNITNEYGEYVSLPMMFLMQDIAVKSEFPASQNRYDF